jgi:hypothetical protein
LRSQTKRILAKIENYFEGSKSEWIVERIFKYDVRLIYYEPFFSISKGFFPTPEWLKGRKAIINIQNTDGQCFLKCIYRHYNKDPQRHDYRDIPQDKLEAFLHARKINTSMLKFPLNPDCIAKFEEANKISITIVYIGPDGPHQTNLMYVSIYEDNPSFPNADRITLGYLKQLEYYTINSEPRVRYKTILSL